MSLRDAVETQYGKHVVAFNRYRDVFRLRFRGQHSNLCLKPFDGSEETVQFLSRVYKHLVKAGFPYGPRMVLTVDEEPYFQDEGTYYMLSNWVKGRKPRLQEEREWRKAVVQLARFHRVAQGMDPASAPASRLRYEGQEAQIHGYRAKIESELGSSRLLALCDRAIERLTGDPLVIAAIQADKNKGAFVHGDYNYPNLVLDSSHRLHLIDFENSSMAARMNDLAHLLQRNCAWDARKTIEAVRMYQKHRPLSKEDRHLLYALLLVPYPIVRRMRESSQISRIKASIPSRRAIREYEQRLQKLL